MHSALCKAMKFLRSDLLQIAAQASSLFQHLNSPLGQPVDPDSNLESERLNRWCDVAADGDWSDFQKRLEWDGLDLKTARILVHPLITPAVAEPLPEWIDTLEAIIANAILPLPEVPLPVVPDQPQPFEDILLPIVIAARQELHTKLQAEWPDNPAMAKLTIQTPGMELLSEAAYLQLERGLLESLVSLTTKTLDHEFTSSRPIAHNLLLFFASTQSGELGKENYAQFVRNLLQDGLLSLFKKYPVLARLIATRVIFWVEATLEFIRYLHEDLSALAALFMPDTAVTNVLFLEYPGQVIELHSALSDPHCQGRAAIALTFSAGLKLIYKPKDLGLDVAFFQFLAWCNQQDLPLSFRILKVLNRGSHGWVEYVEHQPCADQAAAQRFYQRAGMLMGILYLLGATDCHHENLIASGEDLILIDTETLLHPEANSIDGSGVEQVTTAADLLLSDSVFNTGLLPNWSFSADKRIAYDLSGLGSTEIQPNPWRLPRWQAINTDAMRLVNQEATMPLQKNVALLNDRPLDPEDYLAELLTGFTQIHNLLVQQREELQSSHSPLVAFQHQPVRLVFRHTQVYGVILQKSLEPQWLQDGRDHSIQLEGLCRALLIFADKPLAWPLLHLELAALEQMDIPYFATSTSSDALEIVPGSVIPRYFQTASYAQLQARLDKLNPADLALQQAIIRGTFQARVAHRPMPSQQSSASITLLGDRLPTPTLTPDQFLNEALSLAWQLETAAIRGKDGSATWLGFDYIGDADRFQLVALKENLYEGVGGVAVFLAALYRATGQPQWQELALGALQRLQKFLHNHELQQLRFWAKQLGIGGTTGIASIVYALVKVNEFLHHPSLLADALTISRLITPELIAADQNFDIIGGAAGTILSLLALYRATGDTTVLATAEMCGRHLLKHQGGEGAWINFAEKPLTGMSHGAAGIAYALLELFSQTQVDDYRQAAIGGITYEQQLFSPDAANWPDLRTFVQQEGLAEFPMSWCHGAPGIGLARLGGLTSLSTPEIYRDIEIALCTTQRQGTQGLDHVCCGNFGRIELLLVAAGKLARPELLDTARYLASQTVTRATTQGGYRMFANLPISVLNPNFFQGVAGVGYQLLRLAKPEQLPSVLLLA